MAATGRSKKTNRSPSDFIIDVTKFCSSIPPSTTPRIAGAIGNPLRSSTKAAKPAMSMTTTSKVVLLIANAPTTQNSMITGISTARGTRRMFFATLMHANPIGTMMRLAMMNSRYTA